MQTVENISVEAFEQLLQDMYTNLQQFSLMLDHEKNLLEKNNTEALDNSSANKQVIIESLDVISAQCQQFFQDKANPFSSAAVLEMIGKASPHKQQYLTKLWQEITALLKECDRKNLVNGIVITTLKNYNNHLLDILTNRPKNDVYSNQAKKYKDAVSTREHKA